MSSWHSIFKHIFAHPGHPETPNDVLRSRAEKKILKKYVPINQSHYVEEWFKDLAAEVGLCVYARLIEFYLSPALVT